MALRPADEVAHDIRCHVHEEMSQRGVDRVTRTELQRVVEDLHPDQSMVEAELRERANDLAESRRNGRVVRYHDNTDLQTITS